MSRADHPRVVSWLGNFVQDRRDAAALLVNSLKLVSETDLRRELGNLVTRLVTDLPGPAAAFPVREVPNSRAAHEEGRDGQYHLIDPALPGSEAIIANFLTTIFRRPATKDALLDRMDLATMRERKVRTVLLVNDFAGTGNQVVGFFEALKRHATICSWTSYHLLDFHVVLYAAPDAAIARLVKVFGEDHVHLVRACPTFASAGWTDEQLADVEQLCVDVAGRRNKRWALGYEQSRALIAFEHTAPNNLPLLLWRVRAGWHSLFEGKAVPDDLLGLFAMAPAPPREPQAGSLGAERLSRVLDLLGANVRRETQIAEATDFTVGEVRRLLALAQALGLANQAHRLTDSGRRAWRRQKAIAEKPLPNRDEPYYPRSLRAGR